MERDDAPEQRRLESPHLSAPDIDVFVLRSASDYIQIRTPVYVTHSAGRYAAKRFRKAQCPIIERLTNSMMMNGRNNGKKLMAVRIVSHAFEIVRSRDGVSVLRN
jgi:Ribosomal protein S7p/S5e